MSKGFFNIPDAKNEPIKSYAPGSAERAELKKMINDLRSVELELPMIIGGKEVTTDRRIRIFPPHDIKHTLGYYYQGESRLLQRDKRHGSSIQLKLLFFCNVVIRNS